MNGKRYGDLAALWEEDSSCKRCHPDLEELVFDSVFEKDNEPALLDIVPARTTSLS